MTNLMADIEKLCDGDIFRWSYRDPKDDRYHCCSRIAIVYDDTLYDTYWHGRPPHDGKWFGPGALPALVLERLGNLSELDNVSECSSDYYDDADIVDLNHRNSSRGNFYLRKGAKRSQGKMLAVAQQRLAEAEADYNMAARRVLESADLIAVIKTGATDVFIPSWR